jgi:hypothetical protein
MAPSLSEQEFDQRQLDAAEQAVRAHPGSTSAQLARLLTPAGGLAPPLPRQKVLALLSELQRRGKVTRRTGQAMVTFYPAEETADAE